MSDAELRNLLLDCLALWEVEGTVAMGDAEMAVRTASGEFAISRAEVALRPVRWFLQTPERASARRPPRALPSVVALLSALRGAVQGASGERLRIGS